MDQSLVMETLYQLKKQIMGSTIISEAQWDKEKISAFMDHPDHLRGIQNIIEQNNYNTKTIFSLYESLIRSLAPKPTI